MIFVIEDLGILNGVMNKDNMCEVCFRAKQTRAQFHVSENEVEDLFEIIHCDIWGPYRVPSSCGACYFLTLVDDGSRSVWLYLMKEKSEVELFLKGFVAMVKTQFDKQVEVVQTNNGFEFKIWACEKFLS